MNRIVDEQRRRNDQSRDSWDRFRAHRERVTALLAGAATDAGRLCVLGAGNSNDLDLAALLTRYGEIHLADLDAHALAAGAARQGYQDSPQVCLHGGLDFTGIADRLADTTPERPPSDAELNRCLELAAKPPPLNVPAPFDTVASVCLLTQLLHSIVLTLGEGHPRYVESTICLRNQHLELLLELVRPGGTAVLVVDFVSSSSCPQLPQLPQHQLLSAAVQLVNQRNFFTGVNPFLLRQLFESAPTLAPLTESVQLTEPWLWDFGPRMYLVCALVVRRKPDRWRDREGADLS